MLNTRIGENYNANDVINSNDLRKRIINVDSRFRVDPCNSLSTDFTYKPEHPYKNLIRLRVASVELPNMFYSFTKNNNCFTVKAYDITGIVRKVTITIEEGNYTAGELITAIQNEFNTKLRNPYGIFFTIAVNPINAKTTITHDGVSAYPVTGGSPVPTASGSTFILDFAECVPVTARCQNWGLGYNLGYRKKVIKVVNMKPTTATPPLNTYYQTAESCIDVVGDTYAFLCINDLHTVEQKTSETYLQCLAKIIIREGKHTVIYDDGASLLTNEIIFPSPTDLKILQVKLVDPYGEIIDLCGMNFSFSLEITEVLNTKLYDFYRNYIWLGTIPSVNYKTVQGSAQPLLKGIGPPW
jgi:hypothetical protein